MMNNNDPKASNAKTRSAWNQNAAFWDERIGEGNDFVEVLIWPAVQRLLNLQPGEHVLDIGCGNGLYSRRMASLGVEVTAFDFAEELISIARRRPSEAADRIYYQVIDATDETALLNLGEGCFDAALCSMALFDMADISPLMFSLRRLLSSGGRFIFSVIHPCFNNPHTTHIGEASDRDGIVVTDYSVKISGYMTPFTAHSSAIRGQPAPQLIFHRPLQELFGVAFEAGFVLDGLEECAFPPEHPYGSNPLSWGGNYSEIPPVLVARLH